MKFQKISVFGDVMLDEYCDGNVTRISPEAPIPIFDFVSSQKMLGGAANVAKNIAGYGAECHLYGLIGDDTQGRDIKNLIKSNRIVDKCKKLENFQTIQKTRIVSGSNQILRIDKEDSHNEFSEKIKEKISKYNDSVLNDLEDSEVVVLSDYAKGALLNCKKLISKLSNNSIVLVDPKGDDFSKYFGSTVITPNYREFETVVGSCNSEDEVDIKAKNLIETLSLSYLLLTRSEDGMTLFSKDIKRHFSTTSRNVFDVTGAGDTVIATLAFYLANGTAIFDAVAKSNIAAGIAVTKLGASAVDKKEIEREYEQNSTAK